jgi:hypothetical protein
MNVHERSIRASDNRDEVATQYQHAPRVHASVHPSRSSGNLSLRRIPYTSRYGVHTVDSSEHRFSRTILYKHSL